MRKVCSPQPKLLHLSYPSEICFLLHPQLLPGSFFARRITPTWKWIEAKTFAFHQLSLPWWITVSELHWWCLFFSCGTSGSTYSVDWTNSEHPLWNRKLRVSWLWLCWTSFLRQAPDILHNLALVVLLLFHKWVWLQTAFPSDRGAVTWGVVIMAHDVNTVGAEQLSLNLYHWWVWIEQADQMDLLYRNVLAFSGNNSYLLGLSNLLRTLYIHGKDI